MTHMKTTKDTVTIVEGDVEVTYSVRPVDEERLAVIEEAAQAFVQTLIECSSFGNSEWTENQ